MSTNTPKKWAVIYCPREGSFTANSRCNKIKQALSDVGIDYDYVRSDAPGSVERLAGMMTENGYQTIIIIGGDAALNDAVNGIVKAKSPTGALPALGVVPNGFGNDFAHYWGFDFNKIQETVQNLACRRTRLIDIGIADIVRNDGVHDRRYFLDCLNLGLVASIIELRRKTRRFWSVKGLSYLASAFLLIFKRKLFNFHFTLNFEEIHHKEMTICVGSATGYGLTPSAVPYNGQLDVTAVAHSGVARLFQGLWLLFTGRFLSHRGIKLWRTDNVRFHDIDGAKVCLDGRVYHHKVREIEVNIEKEKLEFLIPQ